MPIICEETEIYSVCIWHWNTVCLTLECVPLKPCRLPCTPINPWGLTPQLWTIPGEILMCLRMLCKDEVLLVNRLISLSKILL